MNLFEFVVAVHRKRLLGSRAKWVTESKTPITRETFPKAMAGVRSLPKIGYSQSAGYALTKRLNDE